ncbi:hypothetical protein F4679DRAFT_595986 [Xylaria curta]|nr:hypothetical protein F4679DRAFT_595986 [Xylaria curta]
MITQDEHPESDNGTWKFMLDACSSGDIGSLQQLINRNGIKRGGKPIPVRFIAAGGSQVDPEQRPEITEASKRETVRVYRPRFAARAEGRKPDSYGLPNAQEDYCNIEDPFPSPRRLALVTPMNYSNKLWQPDKSILSILFSIYILHQSHGIVRVVLQNPDAEVLDSLCNHNRSFASFSIDSGLRTFLTDACTSPPHQAGPILNVLLDYDADVDDGWGPGGGALFAAVIGHQPVEIINKILSKGINVGSRVVVPAIQQGCVEIIEALLSNVNATLKLDVQKCIKEAEKTGDKDIIMTVKDWAQDREIASRRNADERSRKEWWNFRRFGIH